MKEKKLKSCVIAMLMLAIFFGGMQAKMFVQAAECKHQWADEQVVKEWTAYDPDADIDAIGIGELCVCRHVQWKKYCKICGESQDRYTKTQLTHHWIYINMNERMCTNCGTKRLDYIR